jgi:ATP/maltotriose-dependent transcriptional regulator MalT
MSLTPSDPADGIARFTGTQKSVAEYFIGEVLDRSPSSGRDFLLKTSITERLSSPLATALTGRTDSQAVLEILVSANAFVVSVGGPDNTWFRYHPLLRDLLQHRLSLEQPGTTQELHLQAARWSDDELRIPAEILIAIMTLTFDRTKGTGALVGSSTRLLTLLDRAPRRLVPPHRSTGRWV